MPTVEFNGETKPFSCPACKGYMVQRDENCYGPGAHWMCVECGNHWDSAPVVTEVVFVGQGRVTARATMSDGQLVDLFRYYEDELCFSSRELVGKTQAEAVALFHKKDVAYLRS